MENSWVFSENSLRTPRLASRVCCRSPTALTDNWLRTPRFVAKLVYESCLPLPLPLPLPLRCRCRTLPLPLPLPPPIAWLFRPFVFLMRSHLFG